MRKILIALIVCGSLALAAPALASDAIVTGTITHAVDGTAISGIVVVAQNVDSTASSYAVTSADGGYTFSLPAGTYDLTPYTYVTAEPGVYFIEKTLTITVVSDETKSSQNIALTRRGKFIGHVYASDGVTPVSGAAISTTHANGSASGTAYTQTLSNGSYIATPVNNGDAALSATGTYTFYITKAGYFGASLTGMILAADDSVVTQDITLTPASTVTGTITDSSGAAIANATVTLTKSVVAGMPPFGLTYTALTDSSGKYTVSIYDLTNYNGTAVADYSVSVSKTGYVTKTGTLSIEADAAALTGYNYSLVTGGTITGTVKTSSGSGLVGVTVTANDGFGNSYSATSDASGVYTLASLNASARYTLTATKTNYVGQKSYNVKVTAGGTTSGRDFTLPAAKVFSGTIKTSGGILLEGATISLFKRNKTRSEIADFTYTTKSDGTFSFRNVSPGNYQVKVVKTGYVTIIQDSLAIKSNVTGRIYKPELGGWINGRVYTGKTTGIANADIAVFALNNGKEVAYTTLSTDENGYYTVSGLKKGVYRLKVTSAEYAYRFVNINVKLGVQSTGNINLVPGGSISGFLVDRETGLPVSAYVRVVGTPIAAWANANGYYILDGLATGKYRLNVVSPYYDAANVSNVPVAASKIKTDINFTLNPK